MANPELTGDQYEKLLAYLDDRRGKYFAVLASDIIGIVLTALPAAYCYWARKHRDYGVGIPNQVLYAAILFLVLSVFLPMLLVHGWQVYYGSTCPYRCVKRLAFSVYPVTVRKLEPDTGKHPYKIACTDGYTYICPVFLDYKQAKVCGIMTGICTDYGARYIMQAANVKK